LTTTVGWDKGKDSARRITHGRGAAVRQNGGPAVGRNHPIEIIEKTKLQREPLLISEGS
jgi:hypothetical protein